MGDFEKDKISFEEFEIDINHRQLFCNGEIVILNAKAFDLLVFLVQNGGRILSKEEILNAVWDDKFVEESNLLVQISNLRKVLGDSRNTPRFLVTVPGKGYKFVAETNTASNDFLIETQTISEVTIKREEELSFSPTALAGNSSFRGKLIAAAAFSSLLVACFIGYKTLLDSEENSINQLPAPRSINSIAVLPFQFLNSESEDDGLELGLTESLINRLSGLSNIAVRPIGAVKKYGGENNDLKKVGEELQVDSILEGNIQKEDSRLRLTVRLLNAKSGETIWNEQIDEDFSDIFVVQDRISRRVVSSLQIALSEKEESQLARASTQNVEAYKKYLIARHHWNKRTAEGFSQSIVYFNQAIDLDPTFALAYSGIADSYLLIGLYGFEPTTEAFPKARSAAEKALAIDSELAEGYVSLAMVENLFQYDWKKAEEHFARAIELRPNYSTGHHWFGLFLAMQGRTSEALIHLSHAKELDPLSMSINTDVAFAYYLGNQPEKATEQLEKTLKINPEFPNAHNHLGMNYVSLGRFPDAIKAFEKARQFSNGNAGTLEMIWANGFAANKERAKQLLAEVPKDRKISPFDLAIIYTSIGDKENAIDKLNEAFESRDPQIVPIKVFPPLVSLHREPKFKELLRRMNL